MREVLFLMLSVLVSVVKHSSEYIEF